MTEFWDALELTDDEVELARERVEIQKTVKERDRRICICGHPVNRHHTALGLMRCRAGRMRCPCSVVTPVLSVSDTRGFLAKTEGSGVGHALVRGVMFAEGLAKRQGVELELEWLVEVECQRCRSLGVMGKAALPASITATGFISEEPEAANALLCAQCISELARKVLS